MEINEAIHSIGQRFSIMSSQVNEALTDDNKKIEFVNMVLDQYNETSEQQERLKKLFGEEEMKTVVSWANKKAVEQDYFIMNECIKEDLK